MAAAVCVTGSSSLPVEKKQDELTSTTVQLLLSNARSAAERSYAPYSKQPSGACLLAVSSTTSSSTCSSKTKVYTPSSSSQDEESRLLFFSGSTIDNASFPESLCCIQGALANALSCGALPCDIIAVAFYSYKLSRHYQSLSSSASSSSASASSKGSGVEQMDVHDKDVMCSKDRDIPMSTSTTSSGDMISSQPCGRCRQLLSEFGDIPVYLCTAATTAAGIDCETSTLLSYNLTTTSALLPLCTVGPSSTCPATVDESHISFAFTKVIHNADDDDNSVSSISSSSSSSSSARLPLLSPAMVEKIVSAAVEACRHAYIPYLNFPVGAALITDSGDIIRGCNIMCGSFGCSLCAERCALLKAVSEGRVNAVGREARSRKVENEIGGGGGEKEKEVGEEEVGCVNGVRGIAVVCIKGEDFGRPCGGCRQFLTEFGNFPVYCAKRDPSEEGVYSYEVIYSDDLLPGCFVL
eukprot:GHVQ01018296.1.p1 GENE.GHVQ01018296.1~~GHVQ01018296.1.p1  ORF type:complete len:467 (+),score=143.08 GHVQ01018296.1:290-1690(+)